MSNKPVVVVGAGAAGIMAAWRAATLGAPVILLEKTNRLGTKILISGGGKCNITHDGPLEDVLRAFRPNEARFIRPACYRFPNHVIVDMLTSRGLEVYTRPDGRIFPTHGTAKDVVAILRSYLREAGVDIRLECPVTGFERAGSEISHVLTEQGPVEAGAVVLCTGGSSYPNSGTTGDGWPWARSLGHRIVTTLAALAPIHLREMREDWAGIALRDCVLRGRQSKAFTQWRGDLLFTHRGISGPCCLGISREVSEHISQAPVTLEVDVVPDLSFEELTERFLAYARENPRRQVATWLEPFGPERFLEGMLFELEIPATTPMAQTPTKVRNRLLNGLKGFPLGAVREVILPKGEVVAGGVSLDEVNPQTMQSQFVSNLFLCGEILDIAGPVGGYNLQAAFATGFVAGESACELVRS